VSVVGTPIATLRFGPQRPELRRTLAWLVLFGWGAQIASGVGFGTVSYVNYGQFPDIHGLAIAALGVKVVCASLALLLAVAYLSPIGAAWSERACQRAWRALAGFGVVAITAAAFLRWFS
jgi:hypothetical protein